MILEAASECEGVITDPAPEVLPVAIADYSTNICLRWWTNSERTEVIHTFGRVIEVSNTKVVMSVSSASVGLLIGTLVAGFEEQHFFRHVIFVNEER